MQGEKKCQQDSKKEVNFIPTIICSESESEIEITDFFEESGLSEEDFAELEDPDNVQIESGAFVLVKLATKKTIKYFTAEIKEIHEESYEVQYLKRDPNSQKFTREDETVYEIDKGDIVFKLSHPKFTGGSARRCTKLTFGVNLSNYNVE